MPKRFRDDIQLRAAICRLWIVARWCAPDQTRSNVRVRHTWLALLARWSINEKEGGAMAVLFFVNVRGLVRDERED